MRNNLAILSILFGLLFFSCSRQLPQYSRISSNDLVLKPLEFNYLKGKGKINYQDDSIRLSATANVRIKKDSAIWLSFTAVGVEGARGLITKDSIIFLDRLNKVYYVFDFEELSEKFNFKIDYQLIQSMILGELPRPIEHEEDIIQQGNYFHLRQVDGNVVIDNYINRSTMKVERVEMIEVPTKNTLSFNYGDFQYLDGIPFPFSGIVFLNYTSLDQEFTTKIAFNFKKAEFLDRKLKLPFNIPQKYVRQ